MVTLKKQGLGGVSLRSKGVVSLAVVVAYVALVAVLVISERENSLAMVNELESVHRQEEKMVQLNMLVANALISANDSYYASEHELSGRPVFLALAPLETLLGATTKRYDVLEPHLTKLRNLTRQLQVSPSKNAMAELRGALHYLVYESDKITKELRGNRERILAGYHRAHDKVTLETLFFVFFGVVLLGAVMTIFFARLTWDIRRVGGRAMAIVKGYRGSSLKVTRGDEVGELMSAINHMQSELRDRERLLEVSRQQQFHQEKMAAVGTLAAAVAHEINNPIMAISGIAQAMVEHHSHCPQCEAFSDDCRPEVILEQARRVSLITRQIAEFSTPQPLDPQLTDLNSLVKNTCNFVRFDKRFRRIDLQVDLDSQIMPVTVVGDHITQIVINLLVNAADSLENVNDRKQEIRVATAMTNTETVEMVVADNGAGMDEETLKHACDEFFTTKPPGKGSGLGLFLCTALARKNEAVLSIDSELNRGTTVRLAMPAAPNE